MTPLETFERWLLNKNLGTRYHPIPDEISPMFDNVQSAVNRKQDELTPMFREGWSIGLYMDYVDDGYPDGAADIYESLGVIYLTKGAIMLPFEVFCNMFSHPDVLPDFGNWQRELDGPQHEEGLFTDYDDLIERRRACGRSDWATLPQQYIRFQLLQLCSEAAWGFISRHEIVHIVHGHVGFLKRVFRCASPLHALAMKDQKKVVAPPPDLVYQSLEVWADNVAIGVSLGGLLTKSDNYFLQTYFPTAKQRVFIWAFSIYTLFRIWELKTDPTKLWGDHPPKVLRFQMAMYCAEEVAASKGNLEREEFRAAAVAGIREAEKAIVDCGGQRIVAEEAIGTTDPQVRAHHELISDYHDRVLRAELPKYAYVDLDTSPDEGPNVAQLPPQPQKQP